METAERKDVKAVKVAFEGRSTKKGAFTQYCVFSFRQRKELVPSFTRKSKTGHHWENVWHLLPAKYIVTVKDITNSRKHQCAVHILNVTADGYILEPIEQTIPDWVMIPCEECFGSKSPSEEKKPLIVDMESEMDRAVLCYIEERTAFFATQPLDKQWGQGWNTGSYEHNADAPKSDEDGACKIFKAKYEADLMTPADIADEGDVNSGISVRDINNKRYPWLMSPAGSDKDCLIPAGTTFADFVKKIKEVGGEVYVKYE